LPGGGPLDGAGSPPAELPGEDRLRANPEGAQARIAAFIPGATPEEREAKARMLMSGMSGTLTVARVITDEQKKRRFLDGARKFYFDAVSR